MTENESKKGQPCSFRGAICPEEVSEHKFVKKYIQLNDSVIEFGARYGTTSCEIAYKLKNSGKLIAVEPDSSVWNDLLINRQMHNCKFWLLRGSIGNTEVVVSGTNYASRALPVPIASKSVKNQQQLNAINKNNITTNSLQQESRNRPYFGFQEIQEITNIKATVLLIDCEGCISEIFKAKGSDVVDFKTLGNLLINVKTIILEGDMKVGTKECGSRCVDYSIWERKFKSIGFKIDYKVNWGGLTLYVFIR